MYFTLFITAVCLVYGNVASAGLKTYRNHEFENLKAQVEILLKRDTERENEIYALRIESESQRTEIERLNTKVQFTQDLVKAYGQQSYDDTIHYEHLEHTTPLITEKKERPRRQRISAAVAFFAEIRDHDYVNLGTNQNIRFTDAPLNTGEYSPTQGVFTAPIAGLYLLSTTLSGYVAHSNLGHSEFMIDVNGTPNLIKIISTNPLRYRSAT